jgi:hypothetical protein
VRRVLALLFFFILPLGAEPKRLFILKIDGLGQDFLERCMRKIDPETGKSQLPWMTYVFAERGLIFDNFYSRGISLSAPSWSVLDTGRHTVIRGNVEFDRYTGRPYDYLNFFPFYLGYAVNRLVDMPGVQVLDRAGIPLLADRFTLPQIFMSFQLFQRGIRWETLMQVVKRRLSSNAIIATVENAGVPSYESLIQQQTEQYIDEDLRGTQVLYLDFYDGDVDHQGHATNQPEALLSTLKQADALLGRIWTEIQKSPLAKETLVAVVSDHGMNNVPDVISQTYSITDFFGSRAGGGHHVVTDRPQLSDFKFRGLDPLLSRTVTPSANSFYLAGEAKSYPTAWLDIDGNERTAVHLRNSDFNKIHILLKQLARKDLAEAQRQAAAEYIGQVIASNRANWSKTAADMEEELAVLSQAIAERKKAVKGLKVKPEGFYVPEDRRVNRRLIKQLADWQQDYAGYTSYLRHLRALLAFKPDVKSDIAELIPEMTLGPGNSVSQIQHYVAGPSPEGIVLQANGHFDAEKSFRYVNYPQALVQQRVRNMPQSQLSPRPIDFIAMALPDSTYWLYSDDGNQLVIKTDAQGRISVIPAAGLTQDESGKVHWTYSAWHAGLPLALYEDAELHVPAGMDRATWLSRPHSEKEWMETVHRCRYSNGIIGIIEELSPVGANVPGPAGMSPVMLRYIRRQRELVQADFHVFAADHWNFNVRFPNPGGNHGAFFRISTHAVWMMAGAGIPVKHIAEPYDGLNFASTILPLIGRPAPMPDRTVSLQ